MSLSLSSPVSGVAVATFTAPTFTLVADTSVPAGQKQWLVTARGGTQGAGAGEVHSLNTPFTINFRRPTILKSWSKVLTEAVGLTKGQSNDFTLIIRKSEKVNALGGRTVNMVKCTFSVAPETASTSVGLDDIKGAMSVLGGILGNATYLDGITSTFVDGSL